MRGQRRRDRSRSSGHDQQREPGRQGSCAARNGRVLSAHERGRRAGRAAVVVGNDAAHWHRRRHRASRRRRAGRPHRQQPRRDRRGLLHPRAEVSLPRGARGRMVAGARAESVRQTAHRAGADRLGRDRRRPLAPRLLRSAVGLRARRQRWRRARRSEPVEWSHRPGAGVRLAVPASARWAQRLRRAGLRLARPALGGEVITALAARLGMAAPLIEGAVLSLLLSLRGLVAAARGVAAALAGGDLDAARVALAQHLVSRPTATLARDEVASAVVESVAENLTDAFVAPLCFYLAFGLAGAAAYRAVNTADAMIGYRDGALEWFGKVAARLDDALNFVPARLAAAALVVGAAIAGENARVAVRVLWRDGARTALAAAGLPTAEDCAWEVPRQPEHGDYATNVAMTLARAAKRPPRQIADALAKHFPAMPEVARVEVAGPGFLNVFLAPAWTAGALHDILQAGADYGRGSGHAGQRWRLEFVSANPTGPLVIVNARAAAVGDALARLLRSQGARVTTEFYVNDAGTQFEALARSVEARVRPAFGHEAALPEKGYPGEYLIELAKEYLL